MILLNIGFKGSPVAVLHNQIEVMLSRYLHFYAVNEVLVLRDLLQYLYLCHDSLFIFWYDRDDLCHKFA